VLVDLDLGAEEGVDAIAVGLIVLLDLLDDAHKFKDFLYHGLLFLELCHAGVKLAGSGSNRLENGWLGGRLSQLLFNFGLGLEFADGEADEGEGDKVIPEEVLLAEFVVLVAEVRHNASEKFNLTLCWRHSLSSDTRERGLGLFVNYVHFLYCFEQVVEVVPQLGEEFLGQLRGYLHGWLNVDSGGLVSIYLGRLLLLGSIILG